MNPTNEYATQRRSLDRRLEALTTRMRSEPQLPATNLATFQTTASFWIVVFISAVLIGVSTNANQAALLLADLIVAALLIASIAGIRWAILSLLIETALLDHFTVPIGN